MYKKEAEVSISEKNRETVYQFARTLIRELGGDARAMWFKSHGLADVIEEVKYTHYFPKWQTPVLAYFLDKLMKKAIDITNFSGGKHSAPGYRMVEYRRGKKTNMLEDGCMTLEIEGKKLILSIDSYSTSWRVDIYGNKENREIVNALLEKLKANVKSAEFLKGEKVLITDRNVIEFVNYPKLVRTDLILDKNIWKKLDNNLFFMLKNKEKIINKGLEWRRGILIWGLPGTGKTLFGRILCNEVEETVIWVTPRCIEDEDDVNMIFKMARTLAPTVLFMEDLDFFAQDRNEYGFNEILGELLTQLDGLSPNDGVFVIGTTNKPGILDSAISSRPARFDVKIKFDVPSTYERNMMYRLFLQGVTDNIDYGKLANNSEKFTGAYIKESCIRGILSTLQNNESDLGESILNSIKALREEELKSRPPAGLTT